MSRWLHGVHLKDDNVVFEAAQSENSNMIETAKKETVERDKTQVDGKLVNFLFEMFIERQLFSKKVKAARFQKIWPQL